MKWVIEDLEQLLRGQLFASECIKLVRDAYRPGRTVADAFSSMLAALLAPFDFLLTDAADPHLKLASARRRSGTRWRGGAPGADLAERGRALVEAGYHAQVTVLDGATNVFHHGDRGRERIDLGPARLRAPRVPAVAYEASALLRGAGASPARFSPNVLLRPVVESAVFPTLAYVGGPGEIGYFAQFDGPLPEFGIEPPVVFPRFSATLVEPAVRRLLESLGSTPRTSPARGDELATRMARVAMPPAVRPPLRAGALARRWVPSADRGGGRQWTRRWQERWGPFATSRSPSCRRASAKIVRRAQERESVTLAQMDRVRANLRPGGDPQERVLNVLPFLARHGPELLQRLHAEASVSFRAADPANVRTLPDTSP